MHRTLEEVQMNSKKIFRGNLKVYFPLFTLLMVLLLNDTLVYIAAFAIFSALSVYSAGREYFRLLRVPLYFIVPSSLIIAFFIPGKKVDLPLPINPSEEGLKLALEVLLRSFSAISIFFFLILTTTITEIFSAFKKLKLPDFIVEISLLIYRNIQVLYDELERLERAANSRLGFNGFRNFVRTSSLLAYSLFIKSLERAEKIEMAMESRCYSGKMPTYSEKSSGFLLAFLIAAALFLIHLTG